VDDCAIDDERVRQKLLQKYEIFEIYSLYFIEIKKAIQSGLFDIIAHLDLPKKYGDLPKRSISEQIDEVIEALAKNKVCIEFNTGGFRKPIKEQYPSLKILEACYENDIQVTLGSDSHRPDEVGWEIDRALKMLQEIGYTQIVGFENRKLIFFEI